MADFCSTVRGKRKLLYNGYAYTQDYVTGNTIHWQCEKRSTYKARAHTSIDVEVGGEVQTRKEHTHAPHAARPR